jgi:hypothetical protein
MTKRKSTKGQNDPQNIHIKLKIEFSNSIIRTDLFGSFVFFLLCLMVFNATCNNISVISWRSVLLVEETADLSQITISAVIGTDYIGN